MTAISAAGLRDLIAATKARNAYGGTTVLPGLTVIAMAELALQAQEMREALGPFVEVAGEYFNDWCPDETPAWYRNVDGFDEASAITVGDFRRAARALSPQPREDVT